MDLLTYFRKADIEGFNLVVETMLFEGIMSELTTIETSCMDNKYSFLAFSYIALSANPQTASKFEDYVVDVIVGNNKIIRPLKYNTLIKIGTSIFKDKFNKSEDITRMRFAIRTSSDVATICNILKRIPENQQDARDVLMAWHNIGRDVPSDVSEHTMNQFVDKVLEIVRPAKEFTNELISNIYANHWRMFSDINIICSILEYCALVGADIAAQTLFDYVKRQNDGQKTYPEIIREQHNDLWYALMDLNIL